MALAQMGWTLPVGHGAQGRDKDAAGIQIKGQAE